MSETHGNSRWGVDAGRRSPLYGTIGLKDRQARKHLNLCNSGACRNKFDLQLIHQIFMPRVKHSFPSRSWEEWKKLEHPICFYFKEG
jgi:hypothetical protein